MKLDQVTLAVADVPRAITFYRTLGLRLIVHTDDHYARFVCPDGDTTFSVERAEPPIAPSSATIYFECDDLDARVEALRAAGLVIEGPVDEPWLWREARLRDPDGHPIRLFFAGENRLSPPWRLQD